MMGLMQAAMCGMVEKIIANREVRTGVEGLFGEIEHEKTQASTSRRHTLADGAEGMAQRLRRTAQEARGVAVSTERLSMFQRQLLWEESKRAKIDALRKQQ